MKKRMLVIVSILMLSLTLISCNKEPNNLSDNNINPNFEEPKDALENDVVKDTSDTSTKKEPSEAPKSKKENKTARLYFYDVVEDKIVYYDDTIEVTDKALTTALVNSLKNPSKSGVTPLIAKNINIKSAKLDKANNVFTVDFTDNFVKEMNLGSGPESMTLSALVNTLGYNFNVDNVIITLAGKPYSSGHIEKEVGESFKVNLDKAVKLK
ncbi:MAG: GerMN domain-containing protein [Clostridium sp.]